MFELRCSKCYGSLFEIKLDKNKVVHTICVSCKDESDVKLEFTKEYSFETWYTPGKAIYSSGGEQQ